MTMTELVDEISDCLIFVNETGIIQSLNKSAARWLDVEPGTLKGLPVSDLWRAGQVSLEWQSLAQKRDAEIDFGVQRWAVVTVIALPSGGFALRLRNLTHTHDRLARQALLDASADMVSIITSGGILLAWNQAAADFEGVPLEQAPGRDIFTGVDPEDAISRRELVTRVLQNRQPLRLDFRTRDRTLDLRATPLANPDGVIEQIIFNARDITEQRQTEANLAQAEDQLMLLLEYGPLMVYSCGSHDPYGRISLTQNCQKILGYTPTQLCDSPVSWVSRIHEDDRARVLRELSEIHSRAVIEPLIYRFAHKDDSYRWIQDQPILLSDSQGVPQKILGYWLDVTEPHLILEKLQSSEERYELAVGAMSAGIWQWDVGSPFVSMSPLLRKMLGLTTGQELTRRDLLKRVHPDDRKTVMAELKRHLRLDTPFSFVCRLNVADLRERWCQTTAQAVWNGSGLVQCVAGSILDVTELRALEEERTLLGSALEQTADTVKITDRDGNMVYVNRAFEQTSGYTAREVVGRNPRMLKSGIQSHDFYEKMWNQITQGMTWRGDVTNRCKDGSLYNESQTITPLRDSHGAVTYFLSIGKDVTETRHLEEQLRHSQKLESLGRLTGGIAHDFNNILTVIGGNATFLQEDLTFKDRGCEEICEIVDAVERAAALTRHLLAFSRQQKLAPKVLDLHEMLLSLVRMLRRVIGEDISLACSFLAKTARIEIDPSQLEQVILNLAINARDAMPNGGILSVGTSDPGDDDKLEARTLGVTQPFVLLIVSDTGTGMGQEIRERIFEPFFTTKAQGKGTGLGLSTAYGSIAQSGGGIFVDSTPGLGTTFKIFLPVTIEQAATKDFDDASLDPRGSETVLLVEDEVLVRSIAALALTRKGYQVLEAANGLEAIGLVNEHGSHIDLIVTDVVMPGMSGPEFIRQIRRTWSPKVLFMSGYSDLYQNELMGEPFLHKPFKPSQLTAKVRDVLDRSPSQDNGGVVSTTFGP